MLNKHDIDTFYDDDLGSYQKIAPTKDGLNYIHEIRYYLDYGFFVIYMSFMPGSRYKISRIELTQTEFFNILTSKIPPEEEKIKKWLEQKAEKEAKRSQKKAPKKQLEWNEEDLV